MNVPQTLGWWVQGKQRIGVLEWHSGVDVTSCCGGFLIFDFHSRQCLIARLIFYLFLVDCLPVQWRPEEEGFSGPAFQFSGKRR